FLGKNIADILPPDLAARFIGAFEEAFESDQPVIVEYALPMRDGIRIYETSIFSCNGDKILSMVRDITARKEADEALRQSAELLRLAQNAALVGPWEYNSQTAEGVWSDMIWHLLG